MPITLSVDHERGEVRAIAIGPVTYEDVASHLAAEKHFRGLTYKELLDARGAGVLFTPEEMRKIVALIERLGHDAAFGPTAVVVSTELAFGAFSALGMMVRDAAEIRPFRTVQEAQEWLDSKGNGLAKSAQVK